MLIDTHCHLDAHEFADDREAVLVAARTTGVRGIVVPAVAPENWGAVRDCCRCYPECRPAYGIHPLYLDQAGEHGLTLLRQWLQDEMVGEFPPVAVGEIGLDSFVPGFDAVRQQELYVAQLKLARDLDLPVLLHVRRSIDQVLKGLRRVAVKSGIAHAFNGSRQQADEFIRLGFKLGFGGAMTYPGSTRIRLLAATLPLESIVLETDAPDIPPVWLAGQRNAPGELKAIAQVLADLRSVSLEQIQNATTNNANSVLAGLS
jgi:TatD DNase family protein